MSIQTEVFGGAGGWGVVLCHNSFDPLPVNIPSISARPSLFTLV